MTEELQEIEESAYDLKTVKDMALDIFERLTREQLVEFIRLFGGFDLSEPTDDETLLLLAEMSYMERHPERYKHYTSVEELIADALREDDEGE